MKSKEDAGNRLSVLLLLVLKLCCMTKPWCLSCSFVGMCYDDMDSVYRSNSPESSSHCGLASRNSIRQSQQRYSTADLYKPQSSRRRSPAANMSFESHEWYDCMRRCAVHVRFVASDVFLELLACMFRYFVNFLVC